MSFIQANRNAFDAYNTLYYPLFGTGSHPIFPQDVYDNAPEPDERDYMLALAVQENMSNTPYALSVRALTILAKTFAALRAVGGDTFSEAMIDPAKDIRSFCPDEPLGEPMYPDFPSQVLEIDENQFRMHQIRHYMSTYGVEALAGLLGMDVTVSDGWTPDVEHTEKIYDDETLVNKHIVDIVVSDGYMARIVEDTLARPTRMSGRVSHLAVELFCAGAITDLSSVKFHENMLDIICSAAEHDSAQLTRVTDNAAQHPGDILKAILHVAEKSGKNHLATRQKKAFCRSLGTYDPIAIATNLADLTVRGQKAINMLSVARFGNDNIVKAVDLVASGEVKSFNARVEQAWRDFTAQPIGKVDPSELISIYKERPGVMFRAIGRMFDAGIPIDSISQALSEVEDSFSLATLVQFMTLMSATDAADARDWRGKVIMDVAERERREKNAVRNPRLAALVAPVVASRLAKLDTPFKNKKVYLDTSGFSLVGSVIAPNEVSNTSGAYPPAGMAYDVPADKTVRFFTFWDDRTNRVDVDLHFKYLDILGRPNSLGWNSDFRTCGMVFSGDITTSQDSAEYLDVDMREALAKGVDTIFQHQHVYTRQQWKDIAKCFSGALVVGDKAPDTKLYNSKNVLFHDDMNGTGTEMDYAMIDVPNHYVRILRGVNLPYRHTAFNLETFVSLLVEAQGCELVAGPEDADVVLSVGRAENSEIAGAQVVSLIDEGFFIK